MCTLFRSTSAHTLSQLFGGNWQLNSTTNLAPFFVTNASYRLRLRSQFSLQASADNLFNVDAYRYITVDNGIRATSLTEGGVGATKTRPMAEGDLYRAVLDARRAWNDYLESPDEDEDEVYEAYLEAASQAVPLVGGLLELCVEANLIAISARDREERYVDLAATDARVHADAIIEIVGDIVLGHSEEQPAFERRVREEDDETRFNRAREMFREMNRPNVSRAVDELRSLRDEFSRRGEHEYSSRLSKILNLLQISPPRIGE